MGLLHAGCGPFVIADVSRRAVWVCLLAVQALPAAADLQAILRGIENRYNRARTLEVRFEQTYRGQGRAWKPERGRLWLRKPGRTRWEYIEPPGKIFLTDGKFAYLYSPGANEVERTPLRDSPDWRAGMAFLFGRLDFQRDFRRFTWRQQDADYWVVAQPAAQGSILDQVELLVDAQYRIKQLRLVGQDRSVMEFRFDEEKLNLPLGESLFVFRAPTGARLIETSQ